ncbi:MAG: sensor histidine kinase [Arcobacteraceae bacterium]|jgi:signal transduction histidine kinase|nr:sensor histidine kinase [Arcobacteraceae bacterium]
MKKLLFILLFLNFAFGFESIEVLNPNITIHKSGYFKTDKDLSPKEVLEKSQTSPLLQLPKEAYSFGFDNDTYWFAFEISTLSQEELFLDSKNMVGNTQDLYIFDKSEVIKLYKNGFDVAIQDRTIKSFPIRFALQNNPNKLTYLLKVTSKAPHYTSFAFGNEQEVDKDWHSIYLIMVITSSIFIGFFIYNIFLYFIIKDKSYLFYCIYIFGFFAFNLAALGYPVIFINKMANWIFPFVILIKLIGLTFFAIYFLKLHEKQKRDKDIFLILLGLIAILSVFYVFALAQPLYALAIQLLHFFSLYIGIKSYRNGDKYALHYLLATGMSNILSLGFIFMNQGQFVSFTITTLNFINFALVWDLLMLSLALAYRIKLLQEENSKNERLAMIKSKESTISELSGNIAHQWRQPLAELGAIQTNVETKLRFSQISKEELLSQLNLGKEILQHLSSTINTFQSFFQNNHTNEVFSVNDEIKRCIDFVYQSMENNHIEVSFAEDKEYSLKGSANEFSQIILNIILNAKDILIEKNRENKKIQIELRKYLEGFKIEIKDNAGGIKIEPIEAIFESYITDKEMGTGIGLFIAKTIVEAKFGGKISAYNTKDGAVFEIIF